jgi:hypothetical protein
MRGFESHRDFQPAREQIAEAQCASPINAG